MAKKITLHVNGVARTRPSVKNRFAPSGRFAVVHASMTASRPTVLFNALNTVSPAVITPGAAVTPVKVAPRTRASVKY